VNCVSTQSRTILFQLEPLGSTRLFDHAIVAQSGLCTLKPHVLSHEDTPPPQNTNTRKATPGRLHTDRQPMNKNKSCPSNKMSQTGSCHSVCEFGRRQRNTASLNRFYSRTFVTTPDPTVRPPSRIAKRLPSTRAIGLPRETSTLTLSPGMHISAPPSRLVVPVTSVVRK
jgi:hypothetical protein